MLLPTFLLSRLTEFARTRYGYILNRTLTKDQRNIPSLANNKNNIRGEGGKRRNFSSTQENIHMKKNNKGGREGGKCNSQNSPPGAAMGEAEATAAKSTKASDAAREPATEEEGTAPTTASGVCKKEIQSYESVILWNTFMHFLHLNRSFPGILRILDRIRSFRGSLSLRFVPNHLRSTRLARGKTLTFWTFTHGFVCAKTTCQEFGQMGVKANMFQSVNDLHANQTIIICPFALPVSASSKTMTDVTLSTWPLRPTDRPAISENFRSCSVV